MEADVYCIYYVFALWQLPVSFTGPSTPGRRSQCQGRLAMRESLPTRHSKHYPFPNRGVWFVWTSTSLTIYNEWFGQDEDPYKASILISKGLTLCHDGTI